MKTVYLRLGWVETMNHGARSEADNVRFLKSILVKEILEVGFLKK